MNSILGICQEAADLVATARPTDLFQSDSENDTIWCSVAKSTLASLLRYGDWQQLTKEASFTTSNTRTVYPLHEIAPDFHSVLQNTVWIKDENDRLIGSITAEDWARKKYFECADADTYFKIQNNCIRFLREPGKRVKIVFTYRSNAVCMDSDIDTNMCDCSEKPMITKNTDIPVFDRHIVLLGVLYRWLKRNGMSYEEEYNEYEREVKKAFASGLAMKDIQLSGPVFADMDINLSFKANATERS